MADIESTISGILSDPDAMNRIRELGKSLGLTGDSPPPSAEVQNASKGFDLSSVASLLSGNSQANQSVVPNGLSADSLQSLTRFLPILSKMNTENETTALLGALRPFLSESKRKRLDDAGRMLKIMQILPFIRSQGLL